MFTLYNEFGVRGGNVDRTWNTIAHYNMTPGGWNGWCTLSGFYGLFDEGDERLGMAYDYPADTMDNPGNRRNVGFLTGQQYNLETDEPLMARNPSTQTLVFTLEVSLRTSGTTRETADIGVMKSYRKYDMAGKRGK